MIHFCTLFFRLLECQILSFVFLWMSHLKKFARKIAKIEATLLTQWLVPKGWNDSVLTRTEPLTEGLGAGKDLLFESILGRCVSSNENFNVKNGSATILSGMDLFATQVFITGHQISSTLQFFSLCSIIFVQLLAKEWNHYHTIIYTS